MTSKITDINGEVLFTQLVKGDYDLLVTKTDYEDYEEVLTINEDMVKVVYLNPVPKTSVFSWDASMNDTFYASNITIGSGGGSVDYGDGTTETLAEGSISLTHTFSDTSKTYTVTIDNLTKIGSYCSHDSPALMSVNLSDIVEELGYRCFSYSSMTSVTVPIKVKYLPNGVFFMCGNLTTVEFLGNIEGLDSSCLRGCSLSSVKFSSSTPPWLGSYAFKDVPSTCVIYCPSGSKSDYETVFTEAGYSFTIEEY